MAPKSDKEKKDSKKSAPGSSKEIPGKASPKPKKKEDDDEEEEDDDFDTPKAKKSGKASPKKKDEDEDDDDDVDDEVDEVDEWDKVEEEEEWDPDFDEFDIPRSKTKKSGTTGPKKAGKAGDDDDLGLDDDFKNLDLFNDRGFEEEEDDF